MSAASLQARMNANDPRLYNVNRDVAHNFGFVITEVAKCLEEGRWAALTRIAEEAKVTDEVLGKACEALIKFVFVQAENPKESMAACLARCGWLDLPEQSRVVVMAYLGLITLGIHHRGVREATLNGEGPADTYKKLRWHGRKLALLMKMSRTRRWLYRLRERFRRAWRALTEKNEYDG